MKTLKMTRSALLIGSFSLLLVACTKPGPDPKVAELEKTVAELEKTGADLQVRLDQANTLLDGEVLKLQALARIHDFPGDPLQDFFNSPEFWESTWDSGSSDCNKGCQEANKASRAACAAMTDSDKREACYAEAYLRVCACADGCSKAFRPEAPGIPHP